VKVKFKNLYMDWAERVAQLSHAKRLQVGSVIVKDDTVISYGYNGTPSGWDNNCENKEWWNPDLEDLHPDELNSMYPYYGEQEVGDYIVNGRYRLKTKPEVLHAESNAVAKLAKSIQSGSDAALFVTHAPCMDCAKLIYQSGISHVYYRNSYRDVAGVNFLKQSGVIVEQMEKGQ
jgi:dCMP deaminase